MPDDSINLKDLYEKTIRIEALLEKLVEKLGLTDGNIIKSEADDESPFFNPETKLYDYGYYKKNRREDK